MGGFTVDHFDGLGFLTSLMLVIISMYLLDFGKLVRHNIISLNIIE